MNTESKNPLENTAEWEAFFAQHEAYNEYVTARLKTILRFESWFENTTGQDFPKEWYSIIRQRGLDVDKYE